MLSSPRLVRWGSGSPIVANACPINRTTSSTVRYCTWRLLKARYPVRYFLVKVLRIGTGYQYEASRGSRGNS